jgi:hypothetical protein
MKELLKEMLASLEKDAEMKDYKLSIDDSDKECLMLIWENPSESERWRKSGYAEYLDNFENVQPMCSLAILEIDNKVCAYTLTSEEKYYKVVVLSEDEDGILGLRYTEVIPLLVAALNEQNSKITDLETRLANFENS